METERSFLKRRAAEERLAASQALHPNAQSAHRQLAERYEERSRDRVAAPQ